MLTCFSGGITCISGYYTGGLDVTEDYLSAPLSIITSTPGIYDQVMEQLK